MTQPDDRSELVGPIIILSLARSASIAMQSAKRAPVRWLGSWLERKTTEQLDFFLLLAKATQHDPKTITHRH